MYRVRLPSGEESAFRSVEELALGIQSGLITGEAEIYHANSQRWLPISVHPEYAVAAERASAKVGLSVAEPGPAVPDTDVEILLQGKVPIYKMHSLSAKELEARRRPGWVVPATTGGAALIFLGALALVYGLGRGNSEVGWSRQPSTASPRNRSPSSDAPLSTLPFGALRSAHPSPEALAGRAAEARAEAARILGQSAGLLALRGLLSQQRLTTPESLRAVRVAVASFRPAVAHWRLMEAGVLSAFRDTAAALAHSGNWNPAEFTEWRVRSPEGESRTMARTTDSLLLLVDRGYALIEESGQVDSAGSPRFLQPVVGEEYDRIRAAVTRLADENTAFGEHVPPPLVILRSALGGKTFPVRTTR
ncbi:MAG: hypothetical protein ABI587_04165 [Gemmatimonadales bacterium]